MPAEVAGEYAESVRALILSLAEWTDPAVLTLSLGAAEPHLQAERDIEPRLAPTAGTWTTPSRKLAASAATAGSSSSR